MLQEFKRFILRGNVLDLAVAVILGAAFGLVVTTFTNGILMNLIAALFGQPSFDSITIDVGDGELLIGAFLTALVNFVIIAFALFLVIKAFDQMQRRRRSGLDAEEDTPAPSDEALILAEIRDLLRTQRPG
jgi:large conductance mechanosensitive channel